MQASSPSSREHDDATVLAEPDTSYEMLVQVMDAVRGGRSAQGGKVVHVELLPQHLDRRRADRAAQRAGAAMKP